MFRVYSVTAAGVMHLYDFDNVVDLLQVMQATYPTCHEWRDAGMRVWDGGWLYRINEFLFNHRLELA